jgi:3-oxoacyl-[acyl-carrier protein] reductase
MLLSNKENNKMCMSGKMENKVALITGSGRGIGRAVALKLASEGAKIVINDLDEGPANEVVEEIKAAGGEAVACAGSVTADDFAERFIKTAIDTFGGIDVIVNNAGYTMDSLIGKMSDDLFDALYQVHLKAPFQILRAASGYFAASAKQEAEEGREVFRKVVNISSVAGTGGNVGQANYSSMKSGVLGLTKSLAKEWGRFKVNVNCVAFGFIETRLTQASEEKIVVKVDGGQEAAIGMPPKVIEGFKRMIPLGRAGTPEEAADAVYLMCCPESNYISGQTIICGGGLTA